MTKTRSKRRSTSSGRARDEGAGFQRAAWRLVYAVGLVALWAFLAGALVSFTPDDPPGHDAWPPNDPVRNWCGPVGAWVAYHAVRLVGIATWVIAIGLGVYAWATMLGRRVRLVALRAVGVLMIALAIAGLQAVLLPTSGTYADITGGVLGRAASGALADRFGHVGASLWFVLLGAVGAIVAFDRWVLAGPAGAWRVTVPAARRLASVTSSVSHSAGGSLARAGAVLGGWIRPAPRPRPNDLDDDASVPGRQRRRRPDRPRREPPPRPEPEIEDDIAPVDTTDEDDESELPGAPQVFTAEALREKIARLPVVFGHQTRAVATQEEMRDLQQVHDMPGYAFPTLDLLENPEENFSERLEQSVRRQAEALEAALRQYRIDGEVVGIESGPVITLFHVSLAPGTKVAQLNNVSSDIARALKAVNIRIVPNIPGRDTVGVEVPNAQKEKVRLKELMGKPDRYSRMRLPMFLGKDASGEALIEDLAELPHLLIAGTTGSGKSVCINCIITGFLYTRKPSELKLVLVDPKMVEMSQFKDIPHLMCPVVTEMVRAAAILEWAVAKMDERYELLAEAACRDIASYNALEWEELRARFNPATPEEEARIPRKLPYMVFIIDELADLMMTAKEVEGAIIRIAQKARAVGIHLILATQRPQANVVTGLIKSNMPARISFKVASGMDSRIVLDQKGGELLLGQGDMLYLSPRSHKVTRSQATLVDDGEIRRVVRFMRDIARPSFERQLVQLRVGAGGDADRILQSENNSSASLAAAREDPLFFRAVEIVLETQRGSVSLLQRRLAIGYTRASRLIDLMGIAGIIGEHKGSVAREVLVSPEEWAAMRAQAEADAREQGQLGLFAEQEAAATDEAPAAPTAPESDYVERDAEPDESEEEDDEEGDDDEEWEEDEGDEEDDEEWDEDEEWEDDDAEDEDGDDEGDDEYEDDEEDEGEEEDDEEEEEPERPSRRG